MYCMVTIPDAVARGAPFPITASEIDRERERVRYQFSDLSCVDVPLNDPYWTMRAGERQPPAPETPGAPVVVTTQSDPGGAGYGWGGPEWGEPGNPVVIPGIDVPVATPRVGMAGLALLGLGLFMLSQNKKRRR